jgi:hypothetical protein
MESCYDALINLSLLPLEDARHYTYEFEKDFLQMFIPENKLPMTEDEASRVAEDYIASFPGATLKDVMGYMGKLYAGRYNGKAVSQHVTAYLAARKNSQ